MMVETTQALGSGDGLTVKIAKWILEAEGLITHYCSQGFFMSQAGVRKEMDSSKSGFI